MKQRFKLYANCIPVKGARRSLICDLQRERAHFIPNDLCDILTTSSSISIPDMEELYGKENVKTIEEYLNFLISQEFGFFCDFDELERFPDIDLTWQSPSVITNAIVDIGETSTHDFAGIFEQLEELLCKAIQLRFFKAEDPGKIIEIVSLLATSSISSVEILLRYSSQFGDESILRLAHADPRIHNLIIHSAPENISTVTVRETKIAYVRQEISDESHCGFISKATFSYSLGFFTEGLHHNSCLNRKIGIDQHGNIKNCPSLPKSYGNMAGTTISQALSTHPDFTAIWTITKDQVEICRNCEFRYLCSDCRAFTTGDDLYGKPSKCSYDPFTTKWGS